MRQHVFRGKSLEKKRWIYGNLTSRQLLETDSEEVWKICKGGIPVIIDSHGNSHAVDKRTVGELTGCKDKNGFPIFEGDILCNRISPAPFGVVKWHEHGYFCICDNIAAEKDLEPVKAPRQFMPLGSMLNLSISGTPVDFEVIGNMFDNPEMTK